MGIDPELYEAAKIDGASRFQQIIKISIPSVTPVMTILFILGMGQVFGGDFGLFYQIPRDVGVLYPVTDIIPTYVFRGLQSGSYGMSSAVGLFQSTVGLMMVVLTNMIVKKIEPDNSLF
jgi:putative aldouronate transport system permease protein